MLPPPTDLIALVPAAGIGPVPAWPLAAPLPPPDLGPLLTTALLQAQFAALADAASGELVFVSVGAERLLGERPDAASLGPAWLAARLHPADAPAVAEAQALVRGYLAARPGPVPPGFLFSLDYRLRHADGSYRRVLHQQRPAAQPPRPATGRLLHLFTDITHHKLTHEVRFYCNQPDFAAFARQRLAAPVLSTREQQVLHLVLAGLTSRQIAYHLGLRESTAKAHRRNLLRKAGTHSLHRLLSLLAPPPLSSPAARRRGGAAGKINRASQPCA